MLAVETEQVPEIERRKGYAPGSLERKVKGGGGAAKEFAVAHISKIPGPLCRKHAWIAIMVGRQIDDVRRPHLPGQVGEPRKEAWR